MKLLVTGGSGFIGSNFIHHWLSKNPNDLIMNFDKMTYAAAEWYNDDLRPNNNYSFRRGNINDRHELELIVRDMDCIVNFAAETHVDNSIADSGEFVRSNFLGVHNLLNLAKEFDIRFHQISTDEVFGSLKLESNKKFTEISRYDPKNPYSATKASADLLVRSYVNTYGLRATISNSGNNFGPHQHPEKLIPKTIISALAMKKIPLYRPGNQIRDWIYVEDHCRAIEEIIKRGTIGETYLVSANHLIDNLSLVKLILDKIDRPHSLIDFVEDRPGHDVKYSISSIKLRKELKWNPKFSLKEGIQKTIAHYIECRSEYEALLNSN